MAATIKVFLPRMDRGIDVMFRQRDGFDLVDRMDECDFVIFGGGSDICPSLYGEEQLPETFCSEQLDDADKKHYLRARRLRKKMIGICRG